MRMSVSVDLMFWSWRSFVKTSLSIHALGDCDTVIAILGMGKAKAIITSNKGCMPPVLGNVQEDMQSLCHKTTDFIASCYGSQNACLYVKSAFSNMEKEKLAIVKWNLQVDFCAFYHRSICMCGMHNSISVFGKQDWVEILLTWMLLSMVENHIPTQSLPSPTFSGHHTSTSTRHDTALLLLQLRESCASHIYNCNKGKKRVYSLSAPVFQTLSAATA